MPVTVMVDGSSGKLSEVEHWSVYVEAVSEGCHANVGKNVFSFALSLGLPRSGVEGRSIVQSIHIGADHTFSPSS